MTLENKAGLAVACTCAVLVGAVVWLMQHPEVSWGSPLPAASPEQESDPVPPPDPTRIPAPEPGKGKGKSTDSGKGKTGVPFGDPSFGGSSRHATPREAPPRKESKGGPQQGTRNTASPSFPWDQSGSSSPPGQGSSGDGEKGRGQQQHSLGNAGKDGDIKLAGHQTPAPVSDGKDKSKGSQIGDPAGAQEQFPPFAPLTQDGSSSSSVTLTGPAQGSDKKDKKKDKGKASGGNDVSGGPVDPPFSPLQSSAPTGPSSGKGKTGGQGASGPNPTMAGSGFPLEADSSSTDGSSSAGPKPVTGPPRNKSSGSSGIGMPPSKPTAPTGSQEPSFLGGSGVSSSASSLDKPAPQPGSPEPPFQGGTGARGSPSSTGSGAPLIGAGPYTPGTGSDKQPPFGSSGPAAPDPVMPGKGGKASSPPPPPLGMEDHSSFGSSGGFSPGSAPPPPAGIGNTTPPSGSGTGSIGIGAPPSGKPAPASGSSAVGVMEESIFIPDPSQSAPQAARAPGAPSPAPPQVRIAPTTQPGATGAAPTMIAPSGGPFPAQRPAVAPRVTNATERFRVLTDRDTFASLSQHFYGKPDYGPVLQRHFQNDPRNSLALGPNGQLVPGATVFVPPDPQQLTGGMADAPALSAPVATSQTQAPPPVPPSPPGNGLFGGR